MLLPITAIGFIKMKGKKGVRTVIIYGILILVFLAFFIYLIKEIMLSTERVGIEEACRNSVKLATYKIQGISPYETIKCPTQYETIEAADDNTIKREIAERMRKCWWMFHEGRYELFEEEAENFCVVCYVLDFKEKKKISNFANYLMINTLPMNPDVTYYEYLTPYSTTPELIQEIKNSQDDFIDTNQKYAVMFNYAKPRYLSRLELGLLFSNIGGMPGFYLGWKMGEAPEWAAAVMLWPYTEEEAKRLSCQYAPVKTK